MTGKHWFTICIILYSLASRHFGSTCLVWDDAILLKRRCWPYFPACIDFRLPLLTAIPYTSPCGRCCALHAMAFFLPISVTLPSTGYLPWLKKWLRFWDEPTCPYSFNGELLTLRNHLNSTLILLFNYAHPCTDEEFWARRIPNVLIKWSLERESNPRQNRLWDGLSYQQESNE